MNHKFIGEETHVLTIGIDLVVFYDIKIYYHNS